MKPSDDYNLMMLDIVVVGFCGLAILIEAAQDSIVRYMTKLHNDKGSEQLTERIVELEAERGELLAALKEADDKIVEHHCSHIAAGWAGSNCPVCSVEMFVRWRKLRERAEGRKEGAQRCVI